MTILKIILEVNVQAGLIDTFRLYVSILERYYELYDQIN